ncbi:MAG: hypothetical protein IIZ75_12670 [Lachnospiraceae bacterium]|nr:hypothetical protein [Lachnospiraceae bacterium]
MSENSGYGLQLRGNSYRIIVSRHDKKHYKTWRIPEGLTPRQAKIEAKKVAQKFRDEIYSDRDYNRKVTFQMFSEEFMEAKEHMDKAKTTTLSGYRYCLGKLIPLLRDFRLGDITPSVLQRSLMELTKSTWIKSSATAKPEAFAAAIKESGLTHDKLAAKCGSV